ncbi:iron-containing alcohol dehydrogenase : Putative iron alcohol dehydrogenase OS=Planctomyces maris DSM 8797 GN=PM8797T_21413 PE=4 SV=1: Fe-ADH [Tuwongella immobilis]|uniref:Uncharacterized protein n=1 Tax=Tuwongella immobilis TaxID=692036 RepID=A0A6C2YTJ7_9BACT|nr:iron-containing alcohol dehydrogenase : Putative iron alcohol dehydrogenase OS=Planctomyces maris DSM 8797 GN=PM8797T_21413 PE=4 SV=1: Fe-ADH [Tuwongella immobilis]VTS06695.1 iron-containing alcohol dehydrogenase : Putative iron alcohol dehydrogenase OS=Planctomyces maris DSM 8797 GN=PM8797T_21413 PE=4 SV=1: Fe-ADH [Tuwongella immobilis]
MRVTLFDGVEENPTDRHVEAGTAMAKQAGIDILVGLGGGSAMDCAKGINFILTNGGRMADYKGHGKATKPMLPSIGIPTTAGTGSESQSYALITDESSHLKMACGDRKAAFRISILDPELTLSLPRSVSAITGIDAIAHALESYVCLKRNPVSQMAASTAWRMLEPNFDLVLDDPKNVEARSAMLVGAHFAGMAIENSMLGICHSCANPLTAHYGIAHGIAIGLMLPHVLRFNGQTIGNLYDELAQETRMHNGQPGYEAIAQRIEAMLHHAELPMRLRDRGVSQSILPILAEEANQQWTARFNPRPVTETDLLQVYQAAW